MSAPRAEWKRASAFAEVAEALCVTTKDVCAAWSSDGEVTMALYTTRDDPHGYMIEARLGRDRDGILVRVSADVVTDLRVADLLPRGAA